MPQNTRLVTLVVFCLFCLVQACTSLYKTAEVNCDFTDAAQYEQGATYTSLVASCMFPASHQEWVGVAFPGTINGSVYGHSVPFPKREQFFIAILFSFSGCGETVSITFCFLPPLLDYLHKASRPIQCISLGVFRLDKSTHWHGLRPLLLQLLNNMNRQKGARL